VLVRGGAGGRVEGQTGNGTPPYPIAVTTGPASMVVPSASSPPSAASSPSTRSTTLWKRSTMRRPGSGARPRSVEVRRKPCSSGAPPPSIVSVIRGSVSSTTSSTPGSSRRAKSSGSVKAARSGPAAEEHDLADGGSTQEGEGVLGDVGAGQLVRVGAQHPRDVQRHVAVPDDHDPLVVEAHPVGGDVGGVRVVPAHEPGRGDDARQVLTRDAQLPALGRADRIDHRVEVPDELGDRHGGADLDAERHAYARVRVQPREGVADPLGAGMVRGDAVAHQPAGHGQPVDQGDCGGRVQQQHLGCVANRLPGGRKRASPTP
jgi:hypothetical protein